MKKDYIPFILTILIAIVFIITTQVFNLGLSPDSVSYLEVARNFSEAKGIVDNNNQLVNLWPPGYPILLGTSAWLTGIDVLSISLYVHSILIIIFGFTFILIFRELDLNHAVIAILPVLLLLSRPTSVFFMFWSESLFLVLLSIAILFFIKWIKKDRFEYTLLSGIFSGLFFMTRYAGLGIITGFILFVALSKKTISTKIKNLALYFSPIGLIYFIWSSYSSSFDLPGIEREVVLHIIEWSKIKGGIFTIIKWFIDYNFIEISIPLFVIAILFIWFKVKKYFSKFIFYFKNYKKIIIFSLLLMITYIGVLIFSISLLDANVPLNNRILAPIFPFIVILLGIFLNFFISEKELKKTFYLLTFILLFTISLSAFSSWQRQYMEGNGFTCLAYKNSETINYAKAKDSSGIDIFTNAYDIIHFYTTLKTSKIPIVIFGHTNQSNPNYSENIRNMKEAISKGEAQLIYLDLVTWRSYFMSREDILTEFQGFDIRYFEDGFLIKAKKQ